ncbi:MAG: hypothetical protein ABFC85_05560 [Rectinema sp.]|jgi:hypothetical protein
MGKNANKSPPGKNSDDVLEGLFISPLENSESFEKMEAEEAKILSPVKEPDLDESADASSASISESREQELSEVKSSTKPASLAQEQVILRFAGELKSIKQDLLSIKQHFEAMKKPQPLQSQQPGTSSSPGANAIEQTRGASETNQDTLQLLDDIRKLLLYLDRLLESLPEDKIEEFANSEFFNLYRHVFEKLGIS